MMWPDIGQVTPGAHILLLAAQPAAEEVARALSSGLGASVHCALTQRQCLGLLHSESFDLVLIEDSFAVENAPAVEAVYEAAGATVVNELNFGTSSATRILLQVRSTLARRKAEESRIRAAALLRLQGELSAAISGLLLESQLALKKAGPELVPALQHLVSLAEALCEQLRA